MSAIQFRTDFGCHLWAQSFLNFRRAKTLRVVTHTKVSAVRMLKRKRAYTRFRIHHEPYRQLHADIFRLQQFPEPSLVLKVRTCRIAEAISLATVARRE